jgi:hypothetical protein
MSHPSKSPAPRVLDSASGASSVCYRSNSAVNGGPPHCSLYLQTSREFVLRRPGSYRRIAIAHSREPSFQSLRLYQRLVLYNTHVAG